MVIDILDFGYTRSTVYKRYRNSGSRKYWKMDSDSWDYFCNILVPFTYGYSKSFYDCTSCLHYNTYPNNRALKPLESGWLMGVFDSRCSIFMRASGLAIKYSRVNEPLVSSFSSLGGCSSVCKKSSGRVYSWIIQSKKDILTFYTYSRTYPSYSTKSSRLDLIPTYYSLKKLRAYRPDSPYHNQYLKLLST